MEQFQGSERRILQTIVDSPKDSAGFVEDAQIAKASKTSLQDVQNWLETLEGKGFVERAGIIGGFSAYVTAKGELALRLTSTDQVTRVSRRRPTPIRLHFKGLRSYDEHDADFFLELLPDPGRSDKLPESIRFWKARIEEPKPDTMFRVGVIYGPSGCGKSSLVKAGLLPRLSDPVLRVYVEATPDQTESDLLKGIRWKCPDLPLELGLVETLAALHDGGGLPLGRKLLLVIDQFEQWLVANRGREDTDLGGAQK